MPQHYSISSTVNNLGVQIDSPLMMADHTAAMCQSGFFSAEAAQVHQKVTDTGSKEDTGSHFYQQSTRLL